MSWKLWKGDKKKKEKEEKEYLDYLYRKTKEGVNPSYKPPPTTVTGITCPECGSDQIGSVEYSNRFECEKCGKVFS